MNKIIKIILHLFYWMVYCLFAGAVSFKLAYGFDFIAENLSVFLYNWVWAAVQFYLFFFLLYRMIEKQQYIRYFIVSVVVSISVSVAFTFLFNLVFDFDTSLKLIDFIPQIAGTFIIGQTGSLLRGFIHWFDDIQRKQEMEKMLLRTELDALNAQLNPHFLFNTLNNIDSLIRLNPEKASESLITLSEIMRYMLYEAKKPKVSLRSEVAHYQNIIKLQKLRLKDPSKVEVALRLRSENEVEVAPLLFLPFIENAFKYAVLDAPDAKIEIDLKSDGNKIEFRSSNPYRKNDTTLQGKTGGIGLANLKRRLELLYTGKYSLSINDAQGSFTVILTLDCA
jgi:two-component system, LytTR family, sensor kinase